MTYWDFILRCDVHDSQTNENDSDTHNVEYSEEGELLPKKAPEQEIEKLPVNNALSLNYPNPFNPSTTIKYQIKESGFVTLKIYDVLGKEVAELLNENKEAGFYNLTFNASNLPSGLYIYRMIVNNFVSTKKMLLTK